MQAGAMQAGRPGMMPATAASCAPCLTAVGSGTQESGSLLSDMSKSQFKRLFPLSSKCERILSSLEHVGRLSGQQNTHYQGPRHVITFQLSVPEIECMLLT